MSDKNENTFELTLTPNLDTAAAAGAAGAGPGRGPPPHPPGGAENGGRLRQEDRYY